MPYVFISSKLPYTKTNDAAKIYVASLKEYRSSIKGLAKEIISNAIKARKEYIEATGVYDVEESNLAKFLQIQQKYMTKYHNLGDGYGYDIEVRFKVTEALEMIGFKMPE